jgi:Fe-S-cluster formation regulator IscX/YfhJ
MAEKCPAFKEAMLKSTSTVLECLKGRFSRLKIKGEPVLTHKPASNEEVTEFFRILQDIIDPNLDPQKVTHADLKKSTRLNDFIDRHCRARQYMFQVFKNVYLKNNSMECDIFFFF